MSKKVGGIILACLIGIFIVIIALSCSPSPSNSPPSTSSPSTELPALSNEELNYISTLQDNSEIVGDALQEFFSLISEPQLGNDEWTIDVAAQLVIIQFAYDEAIQMNPPDSMAQIHYKYIQAMSNYNDATDLIISGLDNLDSNKIKQATTKIELGTQYIEETTALINTFMATHQ